MSENHSHRLISLSIFLIICYTYHIGTAEHIPSAYGRLRHRQELLLRGFMEYELIHGNMYGRENIGYERYDAGLF